MSEAHCGCDSFHAYVITVFKFFSFQASMFLPAWWSPSDMVVRRMRLWEFHSKKNLSSIGFKFFRETQKRKKAKCRYTSYTLQCLFDFLIFLVSFLPKNNNRIKTLNLLCFILVSIQYCV